MGLNSLVRIGTKKPGRSISVTNSNYLFSKKWLTINNDFEENAKLKDGDIAKIHLSDVNVTLYDYYWTQAVYTKLLTNAGFKKTLIHHPLGTTLDGYNWKDELWYSPYSIFISC